MNKKRTSIVTVLLLCAVLMMVFPLAACGKKDVQPTAAPDAAAEPPASSPAESPAEEQPAEPAAPTDTPRPTPDAKGMMLYTSEDKGFSFQYNDKYIAMANPAGNAMIYAGGDVGLPFCSVSVFAEGDAASYLKEMAAAAELELEGALASKAGEPSRVENSQREIYAIFYSYNSEDAGGLVDCAYYAENLPSGAVVVYSSTALNGATEAVDSILKTAMETFSMN